MMEYLFFRPSQFLLHLRVLATVLASSVDDGSAVAHEESHGEYWGHEDRDADGDDGVLESVEVDHREYERPLDAEEEGRLVEGG